MSSICCYQCQCVLIDFMWKHLLLENDLSLFLILACLICNILNVCIVFQIQFKFCFIIDILLAVLFGVLFLTFTLLFGLLFSLAYRLVY